MLVRRAVIRDDRLTPMAIRLGDVHGNSCAPERSATSRFFRSRSMVFLGTYSYGLYVYHHFISYYLTTNRTELSWRTGSALTGRRWRCRPRVGASVSLALAYLSYELFREAVSQVETAVCDGRGAGASTGCRGGASGYTMEADIGC